MSGSDAVISETGVYMKEQFRGEIKNPYNALFSLFLALCIVGSRRANYEDLFSTISENFFSPLSLFDVFLFALIFAATLLIISFLYSKKRIPAVFSFCEEKKNGKHLFFWAFILAAVWLLYYLSYYPGGIFSDTLSSIWQSTFRSNKNPLLYNFLVGRFIGLGNSLGKPMQWSFGIMLAVQMTLLGVEILFLYNWMVNRSINRALRTLVMIYMIFCPLIPLYGVSIWKDTPFAMAVLFWMIFIVDLFFQIKTDSIKWRTVIGFIAGMVLTAFTRNGASYIGALLTILLFAMKKGKNQIFHLFLPIVAAAIVLTMQSDGYKKLNVEKADEIETYGSQIQQIAAVSAYGGKISDEQQNVIDGIFPHNNVKEYYTPCIVDSLKWSANPDMHFFETYTTKFIKTWAGMFVNNPGTCIRAFFLENLGFWDLSRQSPFSYVQIEVWENPYELHEEDLLEQYTGVSVKQLIKPELYISSAWFSLAFIFSFLMMMKKHGISAGLPFIPQIGIWVAVMLETPVAFSLRYVSPLVFTLPFALIVPYMLYREQKHSRAV